MSRSYRRTPIIGMTCCDSEKADKRAWHSNFRSHERINLNATADWDEFLTTHMSDVSNPWSMSKDGRQYLHIERKPHLRKYLRK